MTLESGEETTVQEAVVQQEAAESGERTSSNPNSDDFRSMREALREMKGELSSVRSENMQLRQSIIEPVQRPIDPFEGRDESDFLTIAEQRTRENALRQEMLMEKEVISKQNQATSFLSSHPDYEKTMNKYGKTLPIQLRQFLLKDPTNPEVMQAAYAACKDSSSYYKDNLSSAQHENVKRAEENMSKPGAGSSAGSGGTVSLVNKLKSMTKSERMAFSDQCIRNKGG